MGVAALVVLALGAALGAWLWVRPTSDVPDPPASATPDDVVATYLAAGNARDRSTMAAVADDRLVPGLVEIALRDNLVVEDVRVHEVAPTSEGARSVQVPVDFVVVQSDGSMNPGPVHWSYRLEREGEGRAWRIVDQGVT